jgi:DNA-damage-inducible protein J
MGQTNITIRIDEEIKKDAESLFAKLGLNISSAVNVFFRQAIREQAIPFKIRAKTDEEKYNEYFNPYNMKILEESLQQLKDGKVITFTMDELFAMEDMTQEETAELVEKARKRGNLSESDLYGSSAGRV